MLSVLRKTISALIIPSIILTSIPDAQSLSVWTQAENPAQRRSFLQKTLESTRLEYAIGDTQKAILASKGNDVTFLSGGRILAGEALKNDSLKLLGAIINSEVRIVLEARASADPEAYGRIRDHILKDKALADAFGKAYSGAIEPKSAPDHIFTDMIGRTFELIVLLDEHLAEEKDMQSEKIGFLKLIRPQIERSGDFFTGAFTDWNARSFEVRAALANIRETNATIEDSSSISAGDVETKRLKMDTAYIGDVLEEASHLRSQVIMNELFRKFFEAEMVNFERRHDYMMALCGIFDERPNFITANIVQRLVTGMSDTNTEIALLSAQMLAFITERQPEAVGDNEFSELIARMTAPAVTQWHRKDAYGALAVAALARPLRAEEILNIVGAEVRGAIGHKDRSELGFLIYWVYYGLRPDEATPEIVDNMLGGWGKHTYMDALKMIYDKRPDLRQQIVSSIFIKLDSRNWRECENHGYLLARIAESYPDIAPDIRKRLYDTLKGMVIPKEFQGDEPKDNRERELWWQRRARWQEKNQTVDHRRGAVAKIINYSLAFNRDLVDRNIADKIFEIALSDKSSGFIFVGIQSMYEKLVEAAPDMVGVDALDKILKRFEDKLKEEGDVGSFFQKLSEMFSAIVRAKKGSVADDAIKKIKEYLKREPRAGTFEEKQIYYWHAFASEVIGAMTEATAACPTKEIIDRLIELYVKDPFPTSIGQALASIVKVADRPTALKIIDVLKTKIAAGRGGLILPFKDIFAHDVSYITDELVGPILTESLKSFNSVGENATEVLVTVAAQAPYTQGRRVTNEMLRRIESPEQGNFQAREQAIKFLKSVVLFGNMPKLEKTADFIHDRSAGFGLEPSDAPSGLMFLYALAESKDKDFLRLVIKVLDRDRQYDSVRDFVHMGCAFYQQGKFAEFISRVSKEREDSATGELKTAREVVQEMRIEAAQEVRGFEGRILSGWDGVEEFLEQAINNPELAELLIAKIVITMRYLRQGIGDDAGFGGADSVEIRLPRLREILTRLLSVQTIGLLDKRSLLKVLTLGNANLIERLRNEAIAMVAALQGGDGRAGLIGGIRNDIHNRPSPQQLALVKAYRAWLALGCSDPAARQKIVDLGYEVDQSDVIGDAVARQRVIGACDRLINTLEEVYGEGNARTLRTEHTAWRRALVDREAEKAAVAAALECAGKERPTLADIHSIVEARRAISSIVANSTGEVLHLSLQLLNRFEVVFYSVFNRLDKRYPDPESGIPVLKELIANTALNGYRSDVLESVSRELDLIDIKKDPDAYIRLYSIIKRIERSVGSNAQRVVDRYQALAEETARALHVTPEDMGWVENFSSNLFRSDTIYLLALAVKEMKEATMQKAGISGWQSVVSGTMRGKLKFIKDLSELASVTKDDIVVVEELPITSAPITVVAGIIVLKEDCLLSHPAIRARQHGIPFAVCPGRDACDDLLKRYAGKEIIVEVNGEKVAIHEASEVVSKAVSRDNLAAYSAAFLEIPEPERGGKAIIMPEDYTIKNVGSKAVRLAKINHGDENSKHFTLSYAMYEQILSLDVNRPHKTALNYLQKTLINAPAGEAERILENIRGHIEQLVVPQEMLEEIGKVALERLGPGWVFLRSSTNAEDLKDYAGAGLYSSYGMIDPQDPAQLAIFMKRVWSSVWSEEAYYDREANGISHERVAMAVLVHKMIPADYSFVVHTQNPLEPSSDEVIIELVQGLGEALVSGHYEGSPHRYAIDRKTLKIRRLSYANKDLKLVMENGRMVERAADYLSDIFTNGTAEAEFIVRRIAEAAIATKDDFGSEQDIEGCVVMSADGKAKFAFVQSRDQQGAEGERDIKTLFGVRASYDMEKENIKSGMAALNRDAEEMKASSRKKSAIRASLSRDAVSVKTDGSPAGLILFADDILEHAVIMDIEESLKKVCSRGASLAGGKIFIFARDERNAAILDSMIKGMSLNVETFVIMNDGLIFEKPSCRDDTELSRTLIKIARAKGSRTILGMIKGPEGKPEELAHLSREMRVPIVIVGLERGLYSFAQALRNAALAHMTGDAQGWLIILPPIKMLTEDIKARYEEYKRSLQTLQAA